MKRRDTIANQLEVLLAIYHQSILRGNPEVLITHDGFMSMTGSKSMGSTHKSIHRLLNNGWISRRPKNKKSYYYKINLRGI
jgi:hypothetical protein